MDYDSINEWMEDNIMFSITYTKKTNDKPYHILEKKAYINLKWPFFHFKVEEQGYSAFIIDQSQELSKYFEIMLDTFSPRISKSEKDRVLAQANTIENKIDQARIKVLKQKSTVHSF